MCRSRDPWARLRQHLTAEKRRDVQCALSFAQLLSEGHDPVQILVLLALTETDAHSLADRLRGAVRRERIRLDPSSELAQVLAQIDAVCEVRGEAG